MLHYLKGREFYSIMFRIALPIAIQNLVATSLNFVDTIMIGQLGSTELAAVGIANQIFFLMALFLFGVYSGASIFTSQFWGRKDIFNIRKVLGVAVLTGSLAALSFSLAAIFFPRQLLGLFMKDTHVLQLGSDYLTIAALSYVVTSVSFAYGFLSRSVGQARLPMYISAVSLGLNTVLNYLLIFGNFGFPALGVKGAAIATVIARLVEFTLLLSVIYMRDYPLAARLAELKDISLAFVRNFFKTSLTVILNEFTWALGITVYSAIYARMGEHAFAAVQMAAPIQNISMVLFFGIANACGVMLGNQIGAEQEDTAFFYAKKFAVIGPLMAVFIGSALYLSSNLLVSGYKVTPDLKETAASILTVFAVFLSAKIFNLINIVGILRSGGDTRFTLLLDSGGVWVIGVPLAIMGGLVWKLPVYWVVALVSLEEIFKVVLGLNRLFSRKWVRNVVSGMGSGETL